MGLNVSSDFFCRKSDVALAQLDIQKLVDDLLIQGRTKKEALDTWRQVLERAREHGLTFSRSKLKYGKWVKFAGFLIDT